MVVRFPSDPFGGGQGSDSGPGAGDAHEREKGSGGGAGGGEHLAPVTPLRRAGAKAESARHPAGTARVSARASERQTGGTAEVVELPGTTPWNNTWADDRRSAGRRGGGREAAAPRTDDAATEVGAGAEAEDDEADRQAKKVSAVTIRQLARRGMSRWELEQVLLKRELEPEVFGPELDRLETLGVIDDASLAVSLVFTQHSRKGLGRTAIEQDLKRRHIDPELIEIALADIADEDELDRATELAVKRIGQMSSYDDETVRRRLHGFLARKGYNSGIIRQAMDAAFASRKRGGVRFQ